MSSSIKSLLPTPLSMEFISDINALSKLPMALFRFFIGRFSSSKFIDCAISSKPSFLNSTDQKFLSSILNRQKISNQIASGAINSVKLIQKISQKVINLMKTSQLEEMQANLENCQKYIRTVLADNTLIDQVQIGYFLQKLSFFVENTLKNSPQKIQTQSGTVQWSIFNLKKANLNLGASNKSYTQDTQKKTGQDKQSLNTNESNLKTINKIYVKVSFDQNFSTSQIQKLIGSDFKCSDSGANQARLEGKNSRSSENQTGSRILNSKSFTMSLIDFKLFMEQFQKVKNLNY